MRQFNLNIYVCLQNRHAAVMNSNVNRVVVFLKISGVIRKMIVEIILTNSNVPMSLALHLSLHARTDVAYRIFGSVIQRMIAVIVQMKEIFVLRRRVLISSLLVLGRVIVSPNLGCVMATTIALINK